MRKKILRSRSGFEKPESREEAIMQNILGASNVLEPSESNIEEILKSILYNTPYTEEAEFEIEKILLAIKNNGTYDGEHESRDLKILFAILNDLDYTEEAESRIEELFIEWLHQRSSIKVLEGVPPLTFTSLGQPLINYLIEGNTIQTGTPTPENPVMPQGTGERTGNLFDYTNRTEIINNSYINQNGSIMESADYYISYPIEVEVGATYTWRFNSEAVSTRHTAPTVGYYDSNNTLIGVASHSSNVRFFSFTIPTDCEYIRCSVYQRYGLQSEAMLNSGSTALPYEPYGFEISISSASTTTPVYLGEVQTTRRVKKLVLDGTESIELNTVDKNRLIIQVVYTLPQSGTTTATNIICTHLVTLDAGTTTALQQGIAMRYNGTDILFGVPFSLVGATVEDSGAEVRTKVKSYLATQYANGTPMTIWYVLAAEKTGIVNEPLMRIGDYADTLSKEQAGVQIPTNSGTTVIDVNTTVKPSNIYIEYK